MRENIYLGLIITPILLTACGGEETPNSPTNTITINQTLNKTLVTITSGNAQTAAATANTGSESLATGGNKALPFANLTSSVERKQFNITDFSKQHFLNLLTLKDQFPDHNLGRNVTQNTSPCDNEGGTFSATFDDKDTQTLADDTFTLNYNNCTQIDVTMTGTITTTIDSVTGNVFEANAWSISGTTQYINFVWSDNVDAGIINGSTKASISTEDSVIFNTTTSGNNLVIAGKLDAIELIDYVMVYTENVGNLEYSFTLNGNIAGSNLGGMVNVQTTTPFKGIGLLDPHSGIMLITGANNTSIIGTAINSTQVQMEIDSTGDGIIDETKTVDWTSLAL